VIDLNSPRGSLPPSQSSPSFQIVFRPSAHLISLVRSFVADFYQKVIDDRSLASRLALTTHELLENSAKYSTDGATTLYVEVDPTDGHVLLQTANRATPTQVEALKGWFAEIAAAPDVAALYADMVRRTAVLKTGSGGLGLARILAEGDMSMDLTVEGDRVLITARGSISTAS
jgi:hypothetical protein